MDKKIKNSSQKGFSLLLLVLVIGVILGVAILYIYRQPSIATPAQITKESTFIPLTPDELSKRVDENNKKGGEFTLEIRKQRNVYTILQEALAEPEKVYVLYIWNRPNLQLGLVEYANLTALPDEIAKLQNLYMLSIDNVPLSSINPKIASLKNLQILELWNLPLAVFPESILSLDNLHELSLTETKIVSLPADINKLKKLKKLDVRNSPIEVLPNEISELTNLEELNISGTKITSLPVEMANLKSLKTLYIVNTPLKKEQINQIKKVLPNTAVWTSYPGS